MAYLSAASAAVPGGLTNAPADVLQAGLPWPPVLQTDVFDVSWSYNMRCSGRHPREIQLYFCRHTSNQYEVVWRWTPAELFGTGPTTGAVLPLPCCSISDLEHRNVDLRTKRPGAG